MNPKSFKQYWSSRAGERTEMEKLLLLSSLFSVLLVVIRTVVTGKLVFVFLPWNLFLAAVPYGISSLLARKRFFRQWHWQTLLLFTGWLLFIPNSFYIITDLFHLRLREESSRWFDLTLIFSFAWNGLLLGILSVRQMEKLAVANFRIRHSFYFLLPVMWLIAWGVYIGRFLRFNSWDVIVNPFQLIGDIGYMLIHPFSHAYTWGMIGCFAVFMTIIYLSLKGVGRIIQ